MKLFEIADTPLIFDLLEVAIRNADPEVENSNLFIDLAGRDVIPDIRGVIIEVTRKHGTNGHIMEVYFTSHVSDLSVGAMRNRMVTLRKNADSLYDLEKRHDGIYLIRMGDSL
jgi:hypothetical protein